MIRGALALGAALVLAGCASVAPRSAFESGERLSGRLALRVEASGDAPARSLSAAFDLLGSAEAGQLELSTPLGTMIARARWTGSSAELTTPQGSTRHADLASLTRDMLGEVVPVQAMFDWLRGRPWSGASSQALAGTGFRQLGWKVDLTRFDESAVAAEREAAPAVTVRVRLDRP